MKSKRKLLEYSSEEVPKKRKLMPNLLSCEERKGIIPSTSSIHKNNGFRKRIPYASSNVLKLSIDLCRQMKRLLR